MKVITKTDRNLKYKTCAVCRKTLKINERALYKQRQGYGSEGFIAHMTCLAQMLLNEPEFADRELAERQWEETRELLMAKYNQTEG